MSSTSRVRLLVNDSRPSPSGKGRTHYAPGYYVVAAELALEWTIAGKAIDERDGAVHAPEGRSLCAAHGNGRSCVLVDAHAGDHFDLAAGFWLDSHRHVPSETPATPSSSPCPTLGCTVGGLGHAGACNAGRSRLLESLAAAPSSTPCPTKGCTVGPLAHPGACNAGRYAAPAPKPADETPAELDARKIDRKKGRS